MSLLLMVCINLTAGEFTIISKSGKPVLENIINNDIVNTDIMIGKTYSVDTNNYTFNTLTNDSIIIKFSNELTIKIGENSSFGINNFDQNKITTNRYPEIFKYNSGLLNTSLIQGQIEVVNDSMNTTNATYIATKNAIVIPLGGGFILTADKSTIAVICVDGIVKVMDNLNKKKMWMVEKNNMLIVVPQPTLGSKLDQLTRKQNMFTANKLEDGDYANYVESLNVLYKEHQGIMFISMDDKIIGVKK